MGLRPGKTREGAFPLEIHKRTFQELRPGKTRESALAAQKVGLGIPQVWRGLFGFRGDLPWKAHGRFRVHFELVADFPYAFDPAEELLGELFFKVAADPAPEDQSA